MHLSRIDARMLFETMTLKSAALLLGSSLAVGGATYLVYLRTKKCFEETANDASSSTSNSTVEETSPSLKPLVDASSPVSSSSPASSNSIPTKPKKVLVLGLKGAGKSSLIECLTRGAVDCPPAPTTGFNVVQCRIPSQFLNDAEGGESDAASSTRFSSSSTLQMNLWEIGGDDAFRKFWSHFFSDTDCLLFLLDPGAGAGVVGEAAEELARATGDYRMGAVPVVVVATHQDRRQSQREPKELRRLLVDVGISPQVLLRIHGVATPPSTSEMAEGTGGGDDVDGELTAASLLGSGDAVPMVGVEELKILLSKILS